jgi:cellulose synthase/poly-beta-1,6-N-acetylglucosamine synthase-like glycosyltransferase
MLQGLCVTTLILLSLIVVYQWALAILAIGRRPARRAGPRRHSTKFHVLIPAHNEECGLSPTLQSLMGVRYPKDLVDVTVVADRCDDGTAVVARSHSVACLERRSGPPGKGATIAWAIDELRKNGTAFDALIVLDADTIADPALLEAFDEGFSSGHQVQQAYNYLSNPWETPFTRLIAVTSVLRNSLFYGGKTRIGLSGMLTGTGMCFSNATIAPYGWTALSVGEDWEFSASLLLQSMKIYFNQNARVLARESGTLKQASTQRLRWASGRYAVAAHTAWKLCAAGIHRRRPHLVDAALTLVIPTYSAQATLAALALVGTWFVSDPLLPWATLVIGSLSAYFLLGVILTDAPWKTLLGIALIPVFLPWRMAIEILGLLGYGRRRWVRTARLSPVRHKAGK